MLDFRRMFLPFVAGIGLFCVASIPAKADPIILITVDEFGNGTLLNPASFTLPFSFLADPGPGGLASVGNYNLLNPPGLVVGDVLLFEQNTNSATSDLLRFSAVGNGSLFFYSDSDADGVAPVDKGLPGALFGNLVVLNEVPIPGGSGAVYTPTANQPGFVPGFAVTYTFVSDVPEPATTTLLISGLAVVAGLRYRRRLVK